MRLRLGRVLEQEVHSHHSINSLSAIEPLKLQSLMSQQKDNMSTQGGDHADQDPLGAEMLQSLRDYLHHPR